MFQNFLPEPDSSRTFWHLGYQDPALFAPLDISDSQISLLTKQKFKLVVKSKVREAEFKYLTEMKKKHSKMKSLKYNSFKLQDYLCNPLFGNESRNLLFRLRTITVIGK